MEEDDTPKYYGQYILKLFVTAQQMGLTATYPSGIIHRYENGSYQRHMFLTLSGNLANLDETSKESIVTIPSGDFACRRISTHIADFSALKEEMKEVLKGENLYIIETDTLSEANKKNGYPFELEYSL